MIDYGSIAYDSAADSQLQSVQAIQNKALAICSGSMKGTPVAALQVECGEMPLRLRRLAQQIKFAIKVTNAKNHAATQIFAEHWTLQFGRYQPNRRPLANKVAEFFGCTPEMANIRGPEWPSLPPWTTRLPAVDIGLTTEVRKSEAPDILASLTREKINSYADRVHVYTDASKLAGGEVGIGCLIMNSGNLQALQKSLRITDNVTVYTGELMAIKLAFESILQATNERSPRSFAIFSDSLSVIEAFRHGRCRSRPNLFNEVIDLMAATAIDVVLVWVPSHIGISGNETADKLAVGGANRNAVDVNVGIELDEAYLLADRFVMAKWQNSWSNEKTGSHYRKLEPLVGNVKQLKLRPRQAETTVARLRLGRCHLNAYLQQMGAHADGLCDCCAVRETIDHFLIECPNGPRKEVKEICERHNISFDLATVLSDEIVLRKIASTIKRKL